MLWLYVPGATCISLRSSGCAGLVSSNSLNGVVKLNAASNTISNPTVNTILRKPLPTPQRLDCKAWVSGACRSNSDEKTAPPPMIMLIGGGAVFSSELLRQAPLTQALQSSLWGVGNGFLSMVLTVGLLMVFEAAFNLTTPLRLLELTNPAQPLLRRLMQVAPGTYNHSILMGNLAEAAAEAIGADPLLARVGAYYHDIGKTQRPDYFIENQIHMKNPHDKLTPNLSKLAVKAHVRDGVNLAEEFGLPR